MKDVIDPSMTTTDAPPEPGTLASVAEEAQQTPPQVLPGLCVGDKLTEHTPVFSRVKNGYGDVFRIDAITPEGWAVSDKGVAEGVIAHSNFDLFTVTELPALHDTPAPSEPVTVPLTAANRETPSDDKDKARMAELEDWRNRVTSAQQHVADAEAQWEDAKKVASARKAVYDEAVKDLCDTIKDQPGASLFNQPRDTETPNGSKPYTPPASSVPATATNPDAWRADPINKLVHYGATEKQIEKLEAAGIHTLGDYQDRANKSPDHWHKDVKGLGMSGRDRVADAMTGYFLANVTTTAQPAPVCDTPAPAAEPLDGGGAVGGGSVGDALAAVMSPNGYELTAADAAFLDEIAEAGKLPGMSAEGKQTLAGLEGGVRADGVSAKKRRMLAAVIRAVTPDVPPADRPSEGDYREDAAGNRI